MAFIRNLTITFHYCGSAKHCLWNVFVAEFSSSFSSIRDLCRICNSSVYPKMNAVAHTQLTFQMLTLLQKISIPPNQYSKTWDSECLALIDQIVRAFSMNPKVGGSSPPQVETFSASTTLTHSQEHPFVCRKWMLLRTQLTFQILTLLKKYLYRQSQYLKTWDSKCLALISKMVRSFGMNSGRDIFCLKNFDIFTRTPVRVSKMNAVARAQFTFQMLTLL